jgi:glycerate 2-kinase
MIQVRNKQQLIDNGKTEPLRNARALAIESLEYAVNSVDPKKIVTSKLSLKDSVLQIEGHFFYLKKYKNIYVVGGGKAAGPMAEALEEILDKHITEGIVNVPHGCNNKTKIIKLHEASHPLPDENGVNGVHQMLEIAQKAKLEDLIICLISGGGSSLMSYPRDDISIEDKRQLTVSLLRSGATINEVNAVRKHLSGFKGGWFAKKAYPATILNIILSDVIGDSLEVIASGPTVPDYTTFTEAQKVLEKYELWTNSPSSVKKVLCEGISGVIEETPKAQDKAFEKVHNVIVGNNRTASLAASHYLKMNGLHTILLTATMEGEAKSIGMVLSAIANEILISNNPMPKPVAVVAGGETTVKVTGKGLGGRNQEIALAVALKLKNTDESGVVIASVGTDGVDGPTDAAGAIVDTKTFVRAEELGLDPEEFLADNDSYHFFSKLKDLIFTGQTGTNVNDISLIIVL